jgi:hypothetical protein
VGSGFASFAADPPPSSGHNYVVDLAQLPPGPDCGAWGTGLTGSASGNFIVRDS